LVNLIGEDLISDEPVAVVELVKNAFDADASKVAVQFDSAEPSKLIAEDDGHGMDFETVMAGWFEPGTVLKRQAERSPGGRVYQGAKGIGRFASARLAESLLLETRTGPRSDGVSVLFEWEDFEGADYLDELEVAWELGDIPELSRGTRLTLANLRKRWSSDDFRELHSRLSRLISPFDDVRDFKIDLQIPGHPELSGEVEPPELLAEPRYQLLGELDSHGRFSGRIKHGGKTVKTYKGEKVGGDTEAPECGAFAIEIRAWDRDREGLDPIAERLQLGIREIRGILDTFSGVSIYRDGFRVYPYGQRGNDWLKLDNRSRQNPVLRLANNQVVAAIRISRESNPDLRDRSTREGMVLNASHVALERWFIRVLALLEEFRYGVRPRRKEEKPDEPLFEPFDISDALTETRNTLGSDHPVTQLMARVERQVTDGVGRIQDIFSRLLMSAGLGQMVDVVIHEIGAPLGKINRQLDLLEREVRASDDSAMAGKVLPMIGSIRGWSEQIHSLRQRLDPQTAGRRGRASSFDVRDEIEDTFALYAALLQSKGISYEIRSPDEPVKVRMSRAALGQVLANLVDNSIYWVGRESKGGAIHATLARLDGGFAVTINDAGPGVTAEDQSQIFDPYFSRKPNGIGLGLYIARLVIEPYGRLTYRDGCQLPGACFEAVFERSVGL
jgi:hypothetical protein